MKTKIFVIIIIVITNMVSYYIGSHTFEWGYEIDKDGNKAIYQTPYIYNTHNALLEERTLCNSVFEMLHMYWQHKDIELDCNDSIVSRHKYFDNVITKSDAYFVADSILYGNWGDFFYEW